jgi:hypothetical protein
MAELPDWQPLNGVAPPVSQGGGAGRVVVLVASEQAVAEGWAAMAAVDLARSWSQSGRRVILVDGGLQHPTLHAAAGVHNGEGLTDATLYGASVGRVSQPLDDGDFFLISAGTPVADTRTVVRSSRWHRLSAGISEAGVTLAVFVRDGESGTAAFLGSASDIVVLASPGEPPPAAVRDLEPLVRAVTGPEKGSVVRSGDSRTAASPKAAGGPGVGRVILWILLAIVIAAVLGLLVSGALGATELSGISAAPEPAALRDAMSWSASGTG